MPRNDHASHARPRRTRDTRILVHWEDNLADQIFHPYLRGHSPIKTPIRLRDARQDKSAPAHRLPKLKRRRNLINRRTRSPRPARSASWKRTGAFARPPILSVQTRIAVLEEHLSITCFHEASTQCKTHPNDRQAHQPDIAFPWPKEQIAGKTAITRRAIRALA